MVGYARDDARGARAADAILALAIAGDSRIAQCGKDRLLGAHANAARGSRDFDLKFRRCRSEGICGALKDLEVVAAAATMPRCEFACRCHERRGTATVRLRVLVGACKLVLDVEHLSADAIEMKMHVMKVRQHGKLVGERQIRG